MPVRANAGRALPRRRARAVTIAQPIDGKTKKAYLLKESLDRLWTYRYEGAALRYLNQWIDQLRWQRLEPFKKLAEILLSHLEGILNYCRVPVRFGVVEAVNGNIKALLRRGRGYLWQSFQIEAVRALLPEHRKTHSI
jgi:transposase